MAAIQQSNRRLQSWLPVEVVYEAARDFFLSELFH